MKRLPQTLTAAALTGALTFGGAAVAQAQNSGPVETATTDYAERHDVAADPITVDGVEYFKQEDGSWLSKPVAGRKVR